MEDERETRSRNKSHERDEKDETREARDRSEKEQQSTLRGCSPRTEKDRQTDGQSTKETVLQLTQKSTVQKRQWIMVKATLGTVTTECLVYMTRKEAVREES